MPLFRVRLEDPNSEHFRVSDIQAPDEPTARIWLMQREYKAVGYRLDPGDLKKLEAAESKAAEWRDLPGRTRAQLHTHRQAEPYEIVSVEEVKK